jgi:hypothetical protein
VPDELTDETWRRLDPYAGQLSTREARRLLLVVVTLVLLVLAGPAVNHSGFVSPRLYTLPPGATWGAADGSDPPAELGPPPAEARADRETATVSHFTWVLNNSWYAVEVTDVDTDVPGLALVGVSGLDEPLRHRERRPVDLTFRVTDCDAVPAGRWPVELTVRRPWGPQVVTVEVGGPGDQDNGRLRDLVCEQG